MHIIRSMPQGEDFEFFLDGRERYFPVRGRPKRALVGDTVFFSHRGKIIGRSTLVDIRPVDATDDMEYLEQGAPEDPEYYYYLCVSPVKRIRGGPSYVGRVGIRYVDKLGDKVLRKRLAELIIRP
jgi:hypothetical protein